MEKLRKAIQADGDRGAFSLRALFTVKGILFVFLAWWILSSPTTAGEKVNRAGDKVAEAGNSLIAFANTATK